MISQPYPPLHELLVPERFRDEIEYIMAGVQPKDYFDGRQTLHAGYLMGTFSFWKKLQLITGIRLETNDIQVNQHIFKLSQEGVVLPQPDSLTTRVNTDWLPSLTAIYNILSDLNLRGSYSKTLARNDFRELAFFSYQDPETRNTVTTYREGIFQTSVDNYDLLLEWFPKPGEVLSVSGFYKRFDRPIETIMRGEGAGSPVDRYVVNLDEASLYGMELNWRKSLGFIAPAQSWLGNLYLAGNYTLMRGKVIANYERIFNPFWKEEDGKEEDIRNRTLQGLSPYTYNLSLLYEGDLWGASVNYNQVGRKLINGGRYEKHDMYEAPRGVLDMQVYGRFLNQRMEVKFNVSDLLNQDIIMYSNHEQLHYRKSATWSPGGSTEEDPGVFATTVDKGLDYNEGDHLYSRITKGIGLSMSVSYKF